MAKIEIEKATEEKIDTTLSQSINYIDTHCLRHSNNVYV